MIPRTGLLTAILATALLGPAHAQSPAQPAAPHPAGQPAPASPHAGPPTLAQVNQTFDEVFGRIATRYVDPTNPTTVLGDALNGMLTKLDPHSYYLTPAQWKDQQAQNTGVFGGLGMQITLEKDVVSVVSPMDGTPAARAGLKPADVIQSADGRDFKGETLQQVLERLRGAPGSTIRLAIARPGEAKPFDVTLTREIIRVQVVTSRLIGDIGYIRMTSFSEQSDPNLRAALTAFHAKLGDKLSALILDLRNNPGGLFGGAIAVANDFLHQGDIVTLRGRQPQDNRAWTAKPQGDVAGKLPLVVMINDGTASAAEIVAGALQDQHRAVLLGTRSFGKGSVQLLFPLDNGGAIRLTTARYYTPSGRSIQAEGIVPDVRVEESRTPVHSKGPTHEADLTGALKNPGSIASDVTAPARSDLPPIATQIPHLPPTDWPKYDPTKPATDFQLAQALVLAKAMAAQPGAGH
jgi:carboxyl-terminal processing protease